MGKPLATLRISWVSVYQVAVDSFVSNHRPIIFLLVGVIFTTCLSTIFGVDSFSAMFPGTSFGVYAEPRVSRRAQRCRPGGVLPPGPP